MAGMQRRWQIYLRNSDLLSRLRHLLLIVFPLWVCTLPLFHFALIPWLIGFFTPWPLSGLFRRHPGLRAGLILGLLGSCFLLFGVFSNQLKDYVWPACAWLWFTLAFAAGTQWFMSSDPAGEALNARLEATLQSLRESTSECAEPAIR